ncbi:MAG TPA: YaaL family protein [Clostridiales bacterium]|jgi:hypothetical protein|nr:YaaL family protein [Clostridiales bacterium]
MKSYLLAFLGANRMEEDHPQENQELVNSIHAARQEWHAALSYFENVSDPDLVDYAIYRVEAAKRKYMYLLKLAKKEGLEDKRVLDEKKQAGQS